MSRHANSLAWDDVQVADLRRLWGEGKSAREIAAFFGAGATRSAIIGKSFRLGLSSHRSPISKVRAEVLRQRKTMALPKRFIVHPTPPREPDHYKFTADTWEPLAGLSPIGLLSLGDDTCRWPVGGTAETPCTGFCGAKPVPGKPYCAEHQARSIGKGSSFERDAVSAAKGAMRNEAKYGHRSMMAVL